MLGLGPSRPTWWGASRTTQAPYPAADGSPVRLVRLNGGHKDREEDEEMRTGRRRWTGRRRRTEAAVLDINTILLVRKKLLIQTERLCKIQNPILSNKMDVCDLDIQCNDEAGKKVRGKDLEWQPKSIFMNPHQFKDSASTGTGIQLWW